MKKSAIVAELKKQRNIIAKARDVLRDLIDDINNDLDSFERGVEYLDDAINSISEVV